MILSKEAQFFKVLNIPRNMQILNIKVEQKMILLQKCVT